MSVSDKFQNAGVPSRLSGIGPLGHFALLGVCAAVGVVTLAWVLTKGAVPVAVGSAAYTLAFGIAWLALRAHYPHRSVGLCNAVTLVRLVLACLLVAALFTEQAATWSVFAIASLAFALDGVDGWLARRAGLSSTFGARFDMEVDAILALVLACLVYKGGNVGAYVLILGLPRYVFWAAQFGFPWLNGDLPERFSRKVVCVLQICVLLALLLPFVHSPVSGILAGTAVAALIWSFGLDVRLLMRARG